MADFLMYETQHPIIIIILIIYFSFFLQVLVELQEYNVPRTAISSSFYVKLQSAFFLLVCRARERVLLRAIPNY